MNNKFEYRCGTSLIIASLLMVVTMVMHPAGGSIEYLWKISSMIMITHSIALISVPFGLLGFWGLTKRLDSGNILSIGAFITMGLGTIAVMCAAAVNGLVLPLFINHYRDSTPEKISAIKPFLNYNISLNHAFDLIYIGAACGAILLWSIVVLKTGRMPKWFGWLGILLAFIAIGSMIAGFIFFSLTGFRIFIFGFVVWTILAGFFLRKEYLIT
ncbi:MAG: hypothetical protein ABI480_10135 [Chitinophagaceae bacterium]